MFEIEMQEEATIQRKKSIKFKNALAIYDDAKKAYEDGEIDLKTLEGIAEELDL
jgi:hypothetical protein